VLCYACVGPPNTIALDQEERKGEVKPAQRFISDQVEELPFEITTPTISSMNHYLNTINNIADESNQAFDNLLGKMGTIK
jgi:hypothetical protein